MPGVELFAWIISALGAVTAIGLAARRIARALRRITHFFDDWEGVEERPGVPGRPGVMARLAAMEGELRHNGGESLKDAVVRTEAAVRDLAERMDGVEAEVRRNHPPPVTINMPTSLNQQHTEADGA